MSWRKNSFMPRLWSVNKRFNSNLVKRSRYGLLSILKFAKNHSFYMRAVKQDFKKHYSLNEYAVKLKGGKIGSYRIWASVF